MENRSQPTLTAAAHKILQARHHDPFTYLGLHTSLHNGQQQTVIRVILPNAISAALADPQQVFRRLDETPIFELAFDGEVSSQHYIIHWTDNNGDTFQHYDAYDFPAQIAEVDLSLFVKGEQYSAGDILGAHLITIDNIKGVLFATWAPNAERVSVVGHFNDWDNRCHPMRARGASGIWEIFIPNLKAGDQYQFEIRNHHTGMVQLRTDPYAQQLAADNPANSVISTHNAYQWQDQLWMEQRKNFDWRHKPISVYEVHLNSWQQGPDGASLNYQTIVEQLIAYVLQAGFTHIKLFSKSPAQSGSGFFAPDSRHGNADDFRYFIDYCHQHHVGVILSWHIDHLSSTYSALQTFDGAHLYEQAKPNSNAFDYSKNGVRNFLISSAIFWLNSFHLDGLELRTSIAMLYQNERQNEDALSLLREINNLAYQKHSGVLMIAEEKTVWPMVTTPTASGGLGFNMKWNIGWQHDTLRYLAHETTERHAHHETLIFSQNYAFSENFILPFSAPGDTQNKTPLLQQMPEKEAQRFANLRLLCSYMFTHPGKKLLFMGNEFASNAEWKADGSLPWALTDKVLHAGLSKMVRKLNTLYQEEEALHYYDFEERGFNWIERHDSSQSLIVFQRNAKESSVIVALNFSAIARNRYRIGIAHNINYTEIFNSDSEHFGGKGQLNRDHIPAEIIPWMKQPFSLTITLPPLSVVIIKPL